GLRARRRQAGGPRLPSERSRRPVVAGAAGERLAEQVAETAMHTLTPAEQYTVLSGTESRVAGGVDPSKIPLRQLAAIRGAMWTVRGPWRFGPRPGDPSNITALEYIYSYGDPYNPNAKGGAFNLNDEQKAMMKTYCDGGYTHSCFGPVTAQSYHGQYPDFLFNNPQTFDRWLDWVQMFWNHGVAPVLFLHP